MALPFEQKMSKGSLLESLHDISISRTQLMYFDIDSPAGAASNNTSVAEIKFQIDGQLKNIFGSKYNMTIDGISIPFAQFVFSKPASEDADFSEFTPFAEISLSTEKYRNHAMETTKGMVPINFQVHGKIKFVDDGIPLANYISDMMSESGQGTLQSKIGIMGSGVCMVDSPLGEFWLKRIPIYSWMDMGGRMALQPKMELVNFKVLGPIYNTADTCAKYLQEEFVNIGNGLQMEFDFELLFDFDFDFLIGNVYFQLSLITASAAPDFSAAGTILPSNFIGCVAIHNFRISKGLRRVKATAVVVVNDLNKGTISQFLSSSLKRNGPTSAKGLAGGQEHSGALSHPSLEITGVWVATQRTSGGRNI